MSMEQHPAYQQQVAPQASAPAAANPWQEAFQALSASLNTPQASQAPAQFSAYQTPTPQANTQASWNSTLSQTPSAAQAQQIYGAPASTPAYSAAAQQQQQLGAGPGTSGSPAAGNDAGSGGKSKRKRK